MTDVARVTHHVVAALKEQVSNRGADSLRGSGHKDGLLFRSHMSLPPSRAALGPGFQSPTCWITLSGCALRLIRWETLESNFQKWQNPPMATLDDVLIFVKVAQFESISRAARSLGMPISTVSRRLSILESKLGVSLLRRTTRRVTLTGQGREYFNQCS